MRRQGCSYLHRFLLIMNSKTCKKVCILEGYIGHNSIMQLVRKINITQVLIASFLTSLLTFLTFFFAFGKDEGTLGEGYIRNFIADSFNLFRFPTHVIAWNFFSSSPLLYLVGLLLNCILYGVLIERIIYFLKKKRDKV